MHQAIQAKPEIITTQLKYWQTLGRGVLEREEKSERKQHLQPKGKLCYQTPLANKFMFLILPT